MIPKGYNGLGYLLPATPSYWWIYGELWGIMGNYGGNYGELWGELWGIMRNYGGTMAELWGIMGYYGGIGRIFGEFWGIRGILDVISSVVGFSLFLLCGPSILQACQIFIFRAFNPTGINSKPP